jgi:hypothetical protein
MESSQNFVDYLHTICAQNRNDTRNVYGMLQIDDFHHVLAWAQHMEANPIPVVDHQSDS